MTFELVVVTFKDHIAAIHHLYSDCDGYARVQVQVQKHFISVYMEYICSKYGFYIIMSEGIIDLHHILFYLYGYHEQTSCHDSAWTYGMTADNHVFRGSSLIGAAWHRFPRGQLVWAASWLEELGRRFQSEQTCFVMLRQKKKICVFPISRPTYHFLADRLRFFYCATQSFFIGDHIEKKWSKSDYFERSYEGLKTKFSKMSANI